MSALCQEVERWESDLETLAETSRSDNWTVEERRLAEAQHTLVALRGRVLPVLQHEQPHDAILIDEIEHLLDKLEDLRSDLLRSVHPTESHQEIAETVAALRALAHVALRFERQLEDAS
jgi:hypothetical protein